MPDPATEVADGARHEHLARLGRGGDAGSDVDRDAGDAAFATSYLSRMQTAANVDAAPLHGFADVAGAADRPCRSVEGREHPVAGRVDELASVRVQLAAHRLLEPIP
jgi:hypothetical protein